MGGLWFSAGAGGGGGVLSSQVATDYVDEEHVGMEKRGSSGSEA